MEMYCHNEFMNAGHPQSNKNLFEPSLSILHVKMLHESQSQESKLYSNYYLRSRIEQGSIFF